MKTAKSTPLCELSAPGIFFALLGRDPRAFQIGKISTGNPWIGKFALQGFHLEVVLGGPVGPPAV